MLRGGTRGWLAPNTNPKAGASLQPGNNGYLMAGDYVQLIEQPHSHVDRSMGDIHPEGKPHVHMDPRNILIVAKELTKRLSSWTRAQLNTTLRNLIGFQNAGPRHCPAGKRK